MGLQEPCHRLASGPPPEQRRCGHSNEGLPVVAGRQELVLGGGPRGLFLGAAAIARRSRPRELQHAFQDGAVHAPVRECVQRVVTLASPRPTEVEGAITKTVYKSSRRVN